MNSENWKTVRITDKTRNSLNKVRGHVIFSNGGKYVSYSEVVDLLCTEYLRVAKGELR